MQPNEGEAPGTLYEYVRELFEAKRLAGEKDRTLAAQRELEKRVTYEKLPDPFRELFARFRVIELLEEVKGRFWTGYLRPAYLSFPEGLPRITMSRTSRTSIDELRPVYYSSISSSLLGGLTGGKYIGEEKTGRQVPADATEFINVIAISSGLTDPGLEYDLQYKDTVFYGRAPGINYINFHSSPRGELYTHIDKVIKADQPPDTLKKVIGDHFAGVKYG